MIPISALVLWAIVALIVGAIAGIKLTMRAVAHLAAEHLDALEAAAGIRPNGKRSERWQSLPHAIRQLRREVTR